VDALINVDLPQTIRPRIATMLANSDFERYIIKGYCFSAHDGDVLEFNQGKVIHAYELHHAESGLVTISNAGYFRRLLLTGIKCPLLPQRRCLFDRIGVHFQKILLRHPDRHRTRKQHEKVQ